MRRRENDIVINGAITSFIELSISGCPLTLHGNVYSEHKQTYRTEILIPPPQKIYMLNIYKVKIFKKIRKRKEHKLVGAGRGEVSGCCLNITITSKVKSKAISEQVSPYSRKLSLKL